MSWFKLAKNRPAMPEIESTGDSDAVFSAARALVQQSLVTAQQAEELLELVKERQAERKKEAADE